MTVSNPDFGSYGSVAANGAAGSESQAAAAGTGLIKSLGGDGNSAEKKPLPWFREIGATSTEPVREKRIWSPDFKGHYEGRKWGESYWGRTWLRLWGRFVVGTAFFAAAQLYGNKELTGYVGEKPKNPLQWVSYAIDKTVGRGLTAIFGKNAAVFHETRDFGYKNKDGSVKMGRSLGHEAVSVTFDFAAMSTGDYMTRYLVGLFDPQGRTRWVKNGHIDLAGGLKELGKTLFKSITYASGEDMFVALPYVYYMKLSRHLINKFSPGFKYDSDHTQFGGAFKVNDKKQVIGDYNMEGIVDITGRFSVYNTGTKMFRDLYAFAEGKVSHLWYGGADKKNEPKKPPVTLTSAMKNSVRYTLVTTTKMMFLMIPSAFLFAVLRTPQYKKGNYGLLVDPERGMVGNLKEQNILGRDVFTNKMYTDSNAAPWYSKITNPIGKMAYDVGEAYEKGFQKAHIPEIVEVTPLAKALGYPEGKRLIDTFSHRYVDAAISYTPYFVVKSDWMTAYYDTNRTNFVLGGFYDSLWGMTKATLSFNGAKIKSSAQEVKKWWHESLLAMLKQPSPNYELQIQRVMNEEGYKASSEAFDIYQGEEHYTLDSDRKSELGLESFLKQNGKRPPENVNDYEMMKGNTGVETLLSKDLKKEADGDKPIEDKPGKHAEKVLRNKANASKEEGWAASVQKREPVMKTSLLDRVIAGDQITPPGNNTAH